MIDSATSSFTLAPRLPEVHPVAHFVARKDELRRLHEKLDGTDKRRTAVIHGLGGIGKTQLAVAYTRQHQADYSAIIWINAKDETSLKQSFYQAARRILYEHQHVVYIKNATANQDVDETLEAVKRWLNERMNNRWLVVYDNYDDVRFDSRVETIHNAGPGASDRGSVTVETLPEVFESRAYNILPYLPEADHGAVVITTRLASVKLGQSLRLDKLSDIGDSLTILATTSQRPNLTEGQWLR